jgi:ferric-dicitrate binding protein FerR (iron transport regulator)
MLVLAAGLYLGMPLLQSSDVPARRYTTLPGQRKVVRLRDGTRIVLAPQTVLVVQAGFGTRNRDVMLSGQANFDVPSSANVPFLVRAGDAVTRVLGTDFTVRRYPGDRDVVVAVSAGKVVTGRGTLVTLAQNMVARLTDSNVVVSSDADLRQYLEWREGRLVFSKVSATEVTTVLGHWYGLKFRFADSALATHLITGAFDDRYPREEVLQNLQLILGVRMVFDHDVVTLIPARPTAAPARRMVPDEMRKLPMEVGQ